jgi:ferric-dicitrate binding protein FerR (iron transport regulator)
MCAAVLAAAALAVLCVRALRQSTSIAASAEIRTLEGHLMHEVGGAERTVSTGERLTLPVTGEFRTDATSEATMETSQGLRLRLDSESRLSLSGLAANGLDGSVELEQGQIHCAVPKLHGGAKFSVVTPNARVVVHGTRFTVRVDSMEAGVTRTCVRVAEGVVSVENASAAALLHAGEEWGCGSMSVASETPPAPKTASVTSRGKGGASRAQGTLAEETALLQSALAAERRGHRSAASVAAARLLARYPDSPLAPEGRAVLDRLSQAPSEGR